MPMISRIKEIKDTFTVSRQDPAKMDVTCPDCGEVMSLMANSIRYVICGCPRRWKLTVEAKGELIDDD